MNVCDVLQKLCEHALRRRKQTKKQTTKKTRQGDIKFYLELTIKVKTSDSSFGLFSQLTRFLWRRMRKRYLKKVPLEITTQNFLVKKTKLFNAVRR